MDNSLPRLRQTTQAADLRIPAAGSHAAGSVARRLQVARSWPLLLILLVQAALSLLLVSADTAFEDEATYLWAGHLEIAHWLHGTPIPVFQSYFSGAPVIYPPLGAVADSLGGLLAARILSLAFMLLATVLLWSCTRRLFGHQAAFFAAALFAVLGPTLHLGAFATYDGLSVFLIGLAAWFVVRAADTRNATGWLVAAGASLAIANAAAYSSALFDVVVIVLALLIPMRELGVKLAASRCLTVLIVAAVLLGAGLLIGGSTYAHGLDVTTLERVPGTASAATVLVDAWSWTGFVVVAAVFGIAISWLRHEGGTQTWLLVLLTVAAVVGPLEQGRLQTAASLDKHVVAGAWFAALAAGYAVDKLIRAAPAGSTRTVTCAACVIALALPVSLGVSQSRDFSTSWPKSTTLVAILGPLVARTSGPLLVEDPTIAEYYLHDESHWKWWSSTRNIVLPSGASSGGPSKAAGIVGDGNAGTYAAKIASGYFSLVALNFADTTSLDHQIRMDLSRNKRYHLVQVLPYGPIPGTNVFGTYVIWLLAAP